MGQFVSSPLKDRLSLQCKLLRKNYSNELEWNHKQIEEFKTARRVLSNLSPMLRPFDPELSIGLVVETVKTTGLGYILLSCANLSPIESKVEGYWHASRRLHYYIRGAPVVFRFIEHKPFPEVYARKQMSELLPHMFKLMQELMEYPFVMKYMPG